MTTEETIKVLMIIQSTYPNFKPEDKSVAIEIWQSVLEDFSYHQISMALKTYIRTNTSGFAPSPGQLIELADPIERHTELSEMEAWAIVSKALRRGNYYAEEEFYKLPVEIQKAVGSPDNIRNWAKAEEQSVETVIQSNFMRAYRTEVKRQNEYRKMPQEVRELIAQTASMIDGTKRLEVKRETEEEFLKRIMASDGNEDHPFK